MIGLDQSDQKIAIIWQMKSISLVPLTGLVGADVRRQAHLHGQRVEKRGARVDDLDARRQLAPRADGLGGRRAREGHGAERSVAQRAGCTTTALEGSPRRVRRRDEHQEGGPDY